MKKYSVSPGQIATIPQSLQCHITLAAQLVKNSPAVQETPICFLGLKDLLKKG